MREVNEKAEFYNISENEAQRNNLHDGWLASHRANIECARYMNSPETGVNAKGFDGLHVDHDGAYLQGCIDKFGWKRTMCVIASSIRTRDWDGRISTTGKVWAENQLGIMPQEQTRQYLVDGVNPGIMDILARSVQRKYDELGLYTAEHCEPNSRAELDYSGKVLVISPEVLAEEYLSPENQIFYARDGFGCSPTAIGRSIRGDYLIDGEQTRLNRSDFIGVMKDECIPEWAREKLEQMNAPEQDQTPEPEENQGMEMNMT